MISYLEFEKPVAALEARIAELRQTAAEGDVDIAAEIRRLEMKSADLLAATYKALTPWQKTQVARHPMRPHFVDYVQSVFSDFMPLGGDRYFGNDQAIIGGFAKLGNRRVMLIGHEKGNDTQSRIKHNFGMGKPEGYRKAIRLMDMAGRFGLPVPMVAVIVGEGGSGGAVALASAERVLMLEHAVYSVISPEGCASILWRTAEKAADAAEAMKVTAQDLLGLGVIDRIVKEPIGGAHRDPALTAQGLSKAISEELDELSKLSPDKLRAKREERFLRIGEG